MTELFGGRGSEKKVEYLELIYDLIFVYMIGRNNSLLHFLENGFIRPEAFLTYILSTLTVLQIWYYTTLFINRYGTNGLAEHIATFINMYLLYYMADGTRLHWQTVYTRYNVAWGLILVNLAVQYSLKLRKTGGAAPWEAAHLKLNRRLLLVQAAIVLASVPVYRLTGAPLSPLGMAFGMAASLLLRGTADLVAVDFPHLTERVMLYVVFTFGEMIIGIAGYFSGGVTVRSVYFSLMAFLIVAGLFLNYGFVYDHLIDRERHTSGKGYMFLHIFLIAAMNNITAALEFMQEAEVDAVPKNIFMAASLLVYFLFLFLLERFAVVRLEKNRRFLRLLLAGFAAFIVLMGALYKYPAWSIAVTVAFIYGFFLLIFAYWRRLQLYGEQ